MFDRRFVVSIADQPDVLGRVVMLCQQRRCQVVSLSFVASDRHRGGELALTVRASAWHGDRLGAWLAGLVSVLDVEELA
jgi:acetolactate synthase small subunit